MNKLIVQIVLIITLILGSAWVFADIFFYLLISLIVATLLTPVTDILHSLRFYRLQIPRAIAILLSYLILTGVVVSFVMLFIPLVTAQIEILRTLDLADLFNFVEAPLHEVEGFLRRSNLTNEPEGFIFIRLRETIVEYLKGVNVSEIVNNLLLVTSSVLIGLLAVLFISFFFLYQKGILKRLILRGVPNAYFEVTITVLYKIDKLLTNYLLGLLIQMLAIFTIVSVGLSVFGVKYSLTIAVFAAVANLIPYIGPAMGAIFALLVGFSTNPTRLDGLEFIFVAEVAIVFAAAQLTDNILLQPIIFSRSVKAHPLEIFVAIFAGAALAGALGMIFAIPVYTVLRVSFTEIYDAYQHYHIFARFRASPDSIKSSLNTSSSSEKTINNIWP